METIKIKIQKTPDFEEVEITLPVYRKTGDVKCHFAKVYSNDRCLWVTQGTYNPSVNICAPSLAFDCDGMVDCTKEEFEAAYQETLAILNSKL